MGKAFIDDPVYGPITVPTAPPAVSSPSPTYQGPAGSGVNPIAIDPQITIWDEAEPDYYSLLTNDPGYLQGLQDLQEDYNLAQMGLRMPSFGAGLAEMRQQAQLQKEGLEHDHKNALAFIREMVGSRGMLTPEGGDLGFRTGEENFDYNMALQGIELGLKSAEAQARQAQANASAQMAQQRAAIELDYKRGKRDVAFDAVERLRGTRPRQNHIAYYIPERDAYQDSNGNWYDRNGNRI